MRAVEVSMFPELRSNKAVGPLPASVVAGTNGDLVVAVRELYFTGTVLDVTYGRGGWWKRWRPPGDLFLFHDIAVDGVDFTALPHPDRSWDTVCYDPPYVPAGGKTTTTAGDFQERFGIKEGRNQDQLDALVFAGLAETARVASGYLLVKCMDYVNGGRYTAMSHTIAPRVHLGPAMIGPQLPTSGQWLRLPDVHWDTDPPELLAADPYLDRDVETIVHEFGGRIGRISDDAGRFRELNPLGGIA